MVCENCGIEHSGEFGSGRFCSLKCSRSFSTKNKRTEINEKIRVANTKANFITLICENCKSEFVRPWSKRKSKNCSLLCSVKSRNSNPEYLRKLSENSKARCSTLSEKTRMKEIGRIGGFGVKGTTVNGTKYQSLFEKECFEYLENALIPFEAHKNLPNSAKETDIYLPDIDVWIELDGINREKRRKWLGVQYDYWQEKLSQYKSNNLILKLFYKKEEFISFINQSYSIVG
jgi:hypothetical protein